MIDHILTNSKEKISQSGVIDIGISDHQLIYLTRKLHRMKSNTHKQIKIRFFKNYTLESLNQGLTMINFSDYEYFNDVYATSLRSGLYFTEFVYANVADASLNIMSMDVPKQVFVWRKKILKNLFPECKKIENLLLIMYKFSQLFTVFDLSEIKEERILQNSVGNIWKHFLGMW